jgi:hypothetical protein
MSLTVAELRMWLNLFEDTDVIGMDDQQYQLVELPLSPSSRTLEFGPLPDEDCEHADFAPIDNLLDENTVRCRECGFEWEAGCLDEDEEESA